MATENDTAKENQDDPNGFRTMLLAAVVGLAILCLLGAFALVAFVPKTEWYRGYPLIAVLLSAFIILVRGLAQGLSGRWKR